MDSQGAIVSGSVAEGELLAIHSGAGERWWIWVAVVVGDGYMTIVMASGELMLDSWLVKPLMIGGWIVVLDDGCGG